MRASCCGLVGALEDGPGDDVGGGDDALRQFHGEAADVLDRPADEACRAVAFVFFGVMALAWNRTAVMTA